MKCKNYLNKSKNLNDFKDRLNRLVENKNDSFENYFESFNAKKLLRKIEGETNCNFVIYCNGEVDVCYSDDVKDLSKQFGWSYKNLSL